MIVKSCGASSMKFCANKIYNDKSLVSDNVDGKLRIIAADIAIPICLVFNLSLLESVCPQAWREVKVLYWLKLA
jgi:hypothetical protein